MKYYYTCPLCGTRMSFENPKSGANDFKLVCVSQHRFNYSMLKNKLSRNGIVYKLTVQNA